MKKIISVSLFLLLILMTILNPTEKNHKDAVKNAFIEKNKISNKKSKNEWEEFGNNLGLLLINNVVDSLVSRENFYVLSFTKVSFKGESKKVGIGIFGKVYIQNVDAIKVGE